MRLIKHGTVDEKVQRSTLRACLLFDGFSFVLSFLFFVWGEVAFFILAPGGNLPRYATDDFPTEESDIPTKQAANE